MGQDSLDEDFVGSLLNQVVDLGINFLDTARGYGKSEERIGRHLSWRRKDYILSTKVGYLVEGYDDWTYDGIRAGIEQALNRMRTDHIDVVFLHSCDLWHLEKGEVVKALVQCRDEGLIGATGYSGENESLRFALNSGAFDVVQCSVNFTDHKSLKELLPPYTGKIGVVAKRPLANAPWRHIAEPHGEYCHPYWLRMKAMGLDRLKPAELEWNEFALRFTLGVPQVSTAIVGSLNIENIQANWAAAQKGPLNTGLYNAVRTAFDEKGAQWSGEI